MTHLRGRQGGMAGLEFALVLPIFMMILFGIVEFGTAFYKQQILTSAVREAARHAIIATDPRPAEAEVRAQAYAYLDEVGLDASLSTVTVTGAGGVSGQPLRVTIQYPTSFAFLANFLPAGAVTNLTMLSSEIVMELE